MPLGLRFLLLILSDGHLIREELGGIGAAGYRRPDPVIGSRPAAAGPGEGDVIGEGWV